MVTFALDQRLAADTIAVGDLALSSVLLMDDARFPWFILVPRRPEVSEMTDLSDEDAAALIGEIRIATRVMLEECFKASGAEPVVVAEMSTIAPMLGLLPRMRIGAIVAINAMPSGMTGLRMIPIESPTPVRTPGMLWRLGAPQAAPVQSFAVIVRKTALGNSLRPGPG